MKRRLFGMLLLSILPLLPTPGAEEEPLQFFRYMRTARRAAAETGRAWYEILCDAVFYSAVDDLGTDMRITRPDHREVPFLVERLTTTAAAVREEELPGRITGVQALPDGRSALEFELETAATGIAALELVTPEKNFRHILSVAVGDKGNWETVLPEFEFQDYPQLNLAARRLNFPKPCAGRFVRMIFGAPGGENPAKPLQINSLKVFRQATYELSDAPELFPTELMELSRTESAEHTVLLFRADRMPLRQLRLESDTPFFLRRVTLAGSDNRRSWTPITDGTIRKIDSDVALTIELPESRWTFYRLSLRNGGETPLAGLKIQAFCAGYRIAIPGKYAAETLCIYYGGKAAKRENEWKPAPELLRQEIPGRYLLQAPDNNPLRPGRGFAAGSHWIASIALLPITGVLLFLLVRRLGDIDDTLPPD